MILRPFQTRFLRRAFAPGIRTAAMSCPRGNGKSTFAGYLAARALTPGDDLYVSGSESVLIGGSIEQCRIVFRAARRILEPAGEHRFLDSATRCAITHKASNTRLRVIGSNAKTSMGLVDCPLAILDEPGCYENIAGGLMWDAIRTAQGKPDSPLRAILIGTIAPATSGWWPSLIETGSTGSSRDSGRTCRRYRAASAQSTPVWDGVHRVFEHLQREIIKRRRCRWTAPSSRSIPTARGLEKKRPPSHRKVPRRVDHQDSSGCRGCSNGTDVRALARPGPRQPGRPKAPGQHGAAG